MGFLSGIFSSKQTRQDVYIDNSSAETETSDENLTGVARYINTQENSVVDRPGYSKKLSRVEEYINTRTASAVELSSAEKDAINTRINAAIELRKTEESLMIAENKELSGVARYVENLEQECSDAQQEEQELTGVARYLANVVENKPVTTGVAKYLSNRVDAKISSVDRYVISKNLADKNKPETVVLEPSSVTKYLESRPTLLTSSVAKYIAKQAVAAKQVLA